ncbi:MAG: hypothetical protein ACREBS_03165 [Nitrososphaerales archaeon]
MVIILDIQLSGQAFAFRILAALFLAGLDLFVFYYLPLHISTIAPYFVPRIYIPEINSLASSFASSALPALGILFAILVFVEVFLRGTWAFGVLLIILGSFWILYDLTLYREGLLFANLLPTGGITLGNGEQVVLSGSEQSELLLFFRALIILFVISSLVTIARGVKILLRKRRAHSQTKIAQQQ